MEELVKEKIRQVHFLGFRVGHADVYYEPSKKDVTFKPRNTTYDGDDEDAILVGEVKNNQFRPRVNPND